MAESRLLVVATSLGLSGTLIDRPGNPGLNTATAADLTTAFLEDTTETARSLTLRSEIRFIVASPEKEYQDPGEHLAKIFDDGFSADVDSICVIGTSAPHLPASYILEAFGRLTQHRESVVVGPAATGVYYLIGASGSTPYTLLKEISWGTPNVLRETLQRAVTSELSISLLPSIMVIETSDHLQQLSRDFRRGVAVAPHTQYIVRKIQLE